MMEQAPVRTHSWRSANTTGEGRSVPAVLCIAGSDSAGMAGIQMDVRSCKALNVHAATAITAITAQNSERFLGREVVSRQLLAQQIEAALALNPQAVKIGMLCNAEQVELIAEMLSALNVPIIYDPVMASSSGELFVDSQTLAAVRQHLLPLCSCITPNLIEAEHLADFTINSLHDREQAALAISALGAKWVVIKGGHAEGEWLRDYCYSAQLAFWQSLPAVNTAHSRGTGCALSSVIASAIASGYGFADALVIARRAIQQGLQQAQSINGHGGPVAVSGFPDGAWPMLSAGDATAAVPFASCVGNGEPDTLGLYPVVDSVQWLERLLPLGITTAQLRIKSLQGADLENAIVEAVALGKRYGCRLFINDYWQLAIKHGAYGVHLGQDDVLQADLRLIQQAGLRLGLSSHCHYEVALALTLQPSYLACGPTFATRSKDMPWIPHGVEGLSGWQRSIELPLVAIGGIAAANIADVAGTGVSGIAMISAITDAADPAAMVHTLTALMASPGVE